MKVDVEAYTWDRRYHRPGEYIVFCSKDGITRWWTFEHILQRRLVDKIAELDNVKGWYRIFMLPSKRFRNGAAVIFEFDMSEKAVSLLPLVEALKSDEWSWRKLNKVKTLEELEALLSMKKFLGVEIV